jgi:hypothetical protein
MATMTTRPLLRKVVLILYKEARLSSYESVVAVALEEAAETELQRGGAKERS